MLENMNYNLIQSVAIISKSLARYDQYIKDASGCPECQDVWRKFKDQGEKELDMLMEHLKMHFDKGAIKLKRVA